MEKDTSKQITNCFNCHHCRVKFYFSPTKPLDVVTYPKTSYSVMVFCRKGMWFNSKGPQIYNSNRILKTNGEGLVQFSPYICPYYDDED